MSRFHQRLREDLRDPEFATAFCATNLEIAQLQGHVQQRKALNRSESLPPPRKRKPQDTQHEQG